jgi:YHS domain-containing protein
MRDQIYKLGWVGVMVLALGSGFALGADQAAEKQEDQAKDNYPLAVCVVSGEKLGEMEEPYVFEYEGREVRLCCSHCEKDFKEDPAGYLKKIDEAAAKKDGPATQPSTQPADDGDSAHHEGHADHD